MPGESEAIEPQPPAQNLFVGNVPIKAALAELRLRLLDLTGRNRLINFRHTAGKSLQFVHTSIDGAFRWLTADQAHRVAIASLPEPGRRDWVERGGRLARPDPKDFAVSVGIDPSYELFVRSGQAVAGANSGSQAQTLLYAEDLGRHCRKIEREAKSAIEETGANMLYLVLGFLEFPESSQSTKIYRAPLICIPVSITRTDEGQYSNFYLNHTGDELAVNLSLREKLKRDFGLNLPEYDPEGSASIDTYLEAVTNAIAGQPNWCVRRMMTLALLSFANMLLLQDLDPDSWPTVGEESALLEHLLVKQVFEGKAAEGDAQYAAEYAIDDHPRGDLPLIYDADSSQHSALIDVLDGHNRVIEGPPGTGKSQTITNLIAAALQEGKKVLFVAEKLAALEVVKSRLALAGLDPFVLELHSNKTSKKRVLEDLDARLKLRVPKAHELPELLERLEQKRQELKAYAELMNAKAGNSLDLTLHQVMWRAELNRLRCGESALAAQPLGFTPAQRTTPAQLELLCDHLRYLASQLEPVGTYGPEHPFWGFFPKEFKPEDDIPVQRALRDYATRFEAFAGAMEGAAALLGGKNLNMSAKGAQQLLAVLEHLAPADTDEVAFQLLPRLFAETDPLGERSHRLLTDLTAKVLEVEALEADVRRHLVHLEPATAAQAAICTEASNRLAEFGLGALMASELTKTREHLQTLVGGAANALQRLHKAAERFAMEFSWSAAELPKVAAIADVVEAAPRELLTLLHDGLRTPNALRVLQVGIERLQANTRLSNALTSKLYLDAVPPDEELSEAIRTLREGDAWYRFFQGRWRSAVRTHRRLQQTKERRSADERRRELEQVRKLVNDQQKWREDSELRAVAGPHFKGEQTPFDELLTLAQWVWTSDQTLEEAQVSLAVFDPLRLDRPMVTALQTEARAIRADLATLREFEETSRAVLGDAAPTLRAELIDVDWMRRLAAVTTVAKGIHLAENAMAGTVRPEVAAREGLAAVRASQALPQLEAALSEHVEAKALFGNKYAGRRTNLEAAHAAHTYGRLVKKARLPEVIERTLLSPDCVANHGQLRSYTAAINSGWQAALDFAEVMSKFGTFEANAWADPSGRSTTEYARELFAKTARAAERSGGLLSWAQYVGARAEATDAGLEGFIILLESAGIAPEKLHHAFLYRFYSALAQSAFETFPALRKFSGRRHTSVRTEYADLDREIIQMRGRQVAQACVQRARPPAGRAGARVADKTEMELLNLLIPQQRPRVPVRQMLRRAGAAVQELKPCFMMGPQAVAQFLAPGQFKFDIVVMDEASQLRPEEAIGAIARGAQLVVVGDPKQLPPTSFFSRMAAADGDGEDGIGSLTTTEAESILDVCTSHFQPVRTLRWHYRSKHESLIAFSNHHFYRGNLVVFPSPYPKSKALGLRYQYIADGVYENQMNHIEARRVVDAAVEHILYRQEDSLGIVTLNIKQRDLVAELLEERLRSLPEAAAFHEQWSAKGMGLFIKNLENVQGDERDCIFISTTFGKAQGTNVVRQNFGPISREGGWRRLNVLFTRAKRSVAVFSSMKPEDIVVDGRTPEGTRALRNYLEYARSGVLPMERETDLPPDSDFEVAVMDVLRERGYEVQPQLGVAGFRIDIGVKHPMHKSGYLAAVECDGATYHSAVSVRDRDRIRQEILESLGWRNRIWRVWSTDWFRNPLAETVRLLQFLDALKAQPVPDEYLVPEESRETVGEASAGDGDKVDEGERPENLVFVDEEAELEVEVGDLVTYARADEPEVAYRVRLTPRQTDPDLGLVGETTPLGSILVGSTVGETVVLRVPGKMPQSFVIRGIRRSAEGGIQ